MTTNSSEDTSNREIVLSRVVYAPRELVWEAWTNPLAGHQLLKPGSRPGENPAGELLTTVTFEELGRKTVLTVQTRFGSAAIADAMATMGMRTGWSESLDRLADQLAKA